MKQHEKSIVLTSAIVILQLVLVSTALAGTPGSAPAPGGYTCVRCGVSTGPGTATCYIQVSQSNDGKTAQVYALDGNLNRINNTPNLNICVSYGTSIQFINDSTNYPQAFFNVAFGNSNPFVNYFGNAVDFQGGTVAGVAPTAAQQTRTTSGAMAYTFNVNHCTYVANKQVNCAFQDPQVIVDGGDKMMCIKSCKKRETKEQELKECIQECERKDTAD